jgi:hypothetical protein
MNMDLTVIGLKKFIRIFLINIRMEIKFFIIQNIELNQPFELFKLC